MRGKPIIPDGPEWSDLRRLRFKYQARADRVPTFPPRRLPALSVDETAAAVGRYAALTKAAPDGATGGRHGG